jgi:hypothetical protein
MTNEKKRQITAAALKMAWKMIHTIFPHYSVSPKDADQLLMATTIVSLEDLQNSEVMEWRKPLPPRTVMSFQNRSSVGIKEDARATLILKQSYSPREIDQAAEEAEEIFVHYHLPEIEIATLYTALPCLGLHAIQDHLLWKEDPPFPELG